MTVFATESESDDGLPHPEDVFVYEEGEDLPESEDILMGVTEVEEPVMSLLSVTGGTYPGSISTTITDYFASVVAHEPGVPYVVFRKDQYNYYLFYGENLRCVGESFSGSGKYVRYESQNGYIYRGTDSLSVAAGNGFVYSNMSDLFPAFQTERQMLNEKVIIFCIVVCFCAWIFSMFWFRRRWR